MTGGVGQAPADQSRVRRAMLWPLSAAALLYGTGARIHRGLYARRWLEARQLDCLVVSVGNLVSGGSGKTPTAAWLAGALHRRGRRVALASRGYRRERNEPVTIVSDGRALQADVAGAGDEPIQIAMGTPGVPVLVGRDRAVVGDRAVSDFDVEVLVLDDAFQHHRVARDVELLTVDGHFGFGNGRVLPRGPLREFPTVLSGADAIVVVDGPLDEPAARLLRRHAQKARCFHARRRPVALFGLNGGATLAPNALGGREVGMLAAVAHPEGFRRTLESLGARVVAERCFRDHHAYRAADLRDLAGRAEFWVTTEKDAVKIPPEWSIDCDLRVLRIEVEVEESAALLDWIEDRLAGHSLRTARRPRLPPPNPPGGLPGRSGPEAVGQRRSSASPCVRR
ncbi:MAG: tetraacyldisaccharide 4'-kinase [Myxococcota bacterium]